MSLTSREFEADHETECPRCGDIIEVGDVIAFDSAFDHDDGPLCPDCVEASKNALGFAL